MPIFYGSEIGNPLLLGTGGPQVLAGLLAAITRHPRQVVVTGGEAAAAAEGFAATIAPHARCLVVFDPHEAVLERLELDEFQKLLTGTHPVIIGETAVFTRRRGGHSVVGAARRRARYIDRTCHVWTEADPHGRIGNH